jgi:two-component system, cell cycle response regulator DivK
MDIQLPGMSGLNATAEIKSDENIRDIPIIAVTAYATTIDEARARSAGCESYVAKPVSVHKLLEMVTGFIGLAGSD